MDAELIQVVTPSSRSLLGLVALFATLRALKAIGLFVREDSVYALASSLSMGTGLLLFVGFASVAGAFVLGPFSVSGVLFVLVGALQVGLGCGVLMLEGGARHRRAAAYLTCPQAG